MAVYSTDARRELMHQRLDELLDLSATKGWDLRFITNADVEITARPKGVNFTVKFGLLWKTFKEAFRGALDHLTDGTTPNMKVALLIALPAASLALLPDEKGVDADATQP